MSPATIAAAIVLVGADLGAPKLPTDTPRCCASCRCEQISCFGPDGLLRRQDYTVDILGGAPGLNYATDCDVDGIIIPTTRRIYAWEGDYQLVPEPRLIAIDMNEITIR
ncbi:MAG: hypothetical protein QOF66_4404 [Mycobacterium sp.]|jgi:hypothetical protein|uniref:hypothetical protein n=1 Tax=Mycobacterium sp. TaxID=1785 RepID=UPI0028B6BEA9|nr:hypothetical protein [Mycobacterium sp.]